MNADDRPPARTRPRPAADEMLDPVVPTNTSAARPTAGVPRRGPEPTVQLNVRIGADIGVLIDRAVALTGRTKRALIEEAIRTSYK